MLHKVLKYLFFTKYNKTFKSARNIKNSKTMGHLQKRVDSIAQ